MDTRFGTMEKVTVKVRQYFSPHKCRWHFRLVFALSCMYVRWKRMSHLSLGPGLSIPICKIAVEQLSATLIIWFYSSSQRNKGWRPLLWVKGLPPEEPWLQSWQQQNGCLLLRWHIMLVMLSCPSVPAVGQKRHCDMLSTISEQGREYVSLTPEDHILGKPIS